MEGFSGYQKRGTWFLVIGIVMAGSILLHMEMGRAKPVKPSVEYIGEATKGEPTWRAPAALPASK
ncbi:MAG: hypothetical protein JST80_11960 [Bdellovibrionales bacterium]|nr:hypothetical protein [Bdellovibrionales bacterium]